MTERPRLLIVGGGLAGLLLAARASEQFRDRLSITLIERELSDGAQASLDTRATALSRDSKDLLALWGFWSELSGAAKAIERIHVSRRSRFGSALLEDEVSAEPMGWVVENPLLQASLLRRCIDAGVEVVEGYRAVKLTAASDLPLLQLEDGRELSADLVVIADGAESSLRSDLGITVQRRAATQFAVAVNCETEGVDNGTAFERFTDEGPLAFLPIPHSDSNKPRYNVIWCAHEATQARLLALSDEDFLRELQMTIGWRVGKLVKMGRRAGWPLSVVVSRELVRARCVLLGNSAHTVHPVAGQGFNLSIRDVKRLLTLIESELATNAPFGALSRLMAFERASSADHEQTILATTILSDLFDQPHPIVDTVSSAALSAVDIMPPIRRGIGEFGMGRR